MPTDKTRLFDFTRDLLVEHMHTDIVSALNGRCECSYQHSTNTYLLVGPTGRHHIGHDDRTVLLAHWRGFIQANGGRKVWPLLGGNNMPAPTAAEIRERVETLGGTFLTEWVEEHGTKTLSARVEGILYDDASDAFIQARIPPRRTDEDGNVLPVEPWEKKKRTPRFPYWSNDASMMAARWFAATMSNVEPEQRESAVPVLFQQAVGVYHTLTGGTGTALLGYMMRSANTEHIAPDGGDAWFPHLRRWRNNAPSEEYKRVLSGLLPGEAQETPAPVVTSTLAEEPPEQPPIKSFREALEEAEEVYLALRIVGGNPQVLMVDKSVFAASHFDNTKSGSADPDSTGNMPNYTAEDGNGNTLWWLHGDTLTVY